MLKENINMTKLQIIMDITHKHHVKSIDLETFSVIANYKHELINLQNKYNILLLDYSQLGSLYLGIFKVKSW